MLNSDNVCDCCGIKDVTVYYKEITSKSGETADVFICERCYKTIDWAEKYFKNKQK